MRSYTPPNAVVIPELAERVFAGQIFDMYQWPQKMFDGSTKIFEMLKRPDTVEIIGIHEDTILVSKERQPHTDYFLGIPAGMHDHADEDELTAAKRELREETGYQFKEWKLIDAYQDSKKVERIIYTFLATELDQIVPQQLDDGEEIEVIRYSFDDFVKMRLDPITRGYPSRVMDRVESLEELTNLPSLYMYENKN